VDNEPSDGQGGFIDEGMVNALIAQEPTEYKDEWEKEDII
jgi:hypothetical protein